ncbi:MULTISPECIES: hypothetical protein [unclassified Moorena]|nr:MULTISPECIES: hypothetical protein [unclassified Moorena]
MIIFDAIFPTPDSRLPTPDSRLPTPSHNFSKNLYIIETPIYTYS